MAGPILPDWLVFDRGWEPSAGMLGRSPDLALPAAAGEADTPEVTPETDPPEEDFLARLPAQPGGFSRVFFSPNLCGTGSDLLPWTKWLPLAGKRVTSRAALGLSGAMSRWNSFSFRIFTLEGLAGISFVGLSTAKRMLFPPTDEARGGSNLLRTFF